MLDLNASCRVERQVAELEHEREKTLHFVVWEKSPSARCKLPMTQTLKVRAGICVNCERAGFLILTPILMKK